MPIKGLLLILLAVIIIAFVNRDQIYEWLQETKDENDEEKTDYTEDYKE